ncbi:hypothetical protein TNCV_2676231 [Trichonephila clavipes]|nr:hypothetical protein TNCV_2676231 [Trichonephila clavipes]
MITNFFIPEVNDHDVQELWFQQDGATCHTARATIDLLKDTFDHFLWGYVKSLVYADKPQTLDHLEDNIRRVIADIRPQMLEKVIENWTSRLDYIRASRGSPKPEIIFKILHAEIVEIEIVSPSIVPSGNFTELNRTVTCMVLKANDRRTSCPCHDEFRGPRSDYVRQVALENNNNTVFPLFTTYGPGPALAVLPLSKKIDLIQLARDLDESPDPSMSKIVLRDLIISSKYYKEEEAKELLEAITAERLETEQQQKLKTTRTIIN